MFTALTMVFLYGPILHNFLWWADLEIPYSSDASGTPEHQIPCYLKLLRLKFMMTYLFPLCTITTDIGQFSTDIEEHIVLPGGPFLHKIR